MNHKITIYRGSHQIGGCATEIRTENHRIIIDFGANLPDSIAKGTLDDETLTQIVFNGEPCAGVLFTHYHGDHIGLYKKIPQDIPLYIGPTAKKLLEILTEKLDSSPNMADKGKYYKKYRPEMIYGKPRRLYIVGDDMEGLGAKENCYKADFSILQRKGFTMLARESNPRFQKIMAHFQNPLIIYSKWTGYLEGKHADPKIKEFIGNHRMEKLHTSGHAYIETIEKLIRLTNPKVIIPMHTECAETFGIVSAFAAYHDRVKVLQDGEAYCY